MGIFDKLKEKFNKFLEVEPQKRTEVQKIESPVVKKQEITTKIGYCKRCHNHTNINKLGYCEQCSLIRAYIEQSTSQDNLMNNRSPEVIDLYNKIKSLTAFDYNKINIENAEIVNDLDGIEKKFLEYLDSKSLDDFNLAGYWIYEHFIDCNYLISKFIKNGYLEISENRSISGMSADELKDILKNANLKVNGSKTDLIKRIEEYLSPDEITSLAASGKKYFVLTDKGNNIKENSTSTIAKDVDLEKECYSLILENKLSEAYSKIRTYESNKLVKRGLNCNWENTNNTQSFNLYIDTTLPFKLPECLIKYEKELKAAAIYAQMMGAGEVKAKSFFVHNNNIDFDKQILDSVFHALYFLAMGVKLPIDFNIGDLGEKTKSGKNIPQSHFEELSIEKFIEQLKNELQEANYDTAKLKYDQLKDGTYNFSYNEFQIGRIKFGKRSSSMQILTKDFVSWLKNETMEIYLSNIKQWIEYIKEVEAERKKYDL